MLRLVEQWLIKLIRSEKVCSSALTRVFCVGKDVLYNIVGFARDSVRAFVTTLGPDNFPSDRKEPWLVDFFAPVCT